MGFLKFIKELFGSSKETNTLPVEKPVVVQTKVEEPKVETVVETPVKVEVSAKTETVVETPVKVEEPKSETSKEVKTESPKTAKEIKAKVKKPVDKTQQQNGTPKQNTNSNGNKPKRQRPPRKPKQQG